MVGSIYILSYHQNCWLMRAERERESSHASIGSSNNKKNDRRRELQFCVVEVSELTHYLISDEAAQLEGPTNL